MKKAYVSDMLEKLIDARDVRNIVRKQCLGVLDHVSTSAHETLTKPLHYIAGKCMGYPAAWLVKHACALDNRALTALIAKCPGPIYVSLTTSIADDFLDREANAGASQMMLLYMFMFESLRKPQWFNYDIERQYLKSVYPVVDFFLKDASDRQAISASCFQRQRDNPGRRIGAFFETIARGVTPGEFEKAEDVVRLAGMFGDWCSLLDDILDTENDIEEGIFLSYPIFKVIGKSDALAAAVVNKEAGSCLSYTCTNEFFEAMLTQAEKELSDMISASEKSSLEELSHALSAVSRRLPETLLENRNLSLDLYRAQRETAYPARAVAAY